jgi:hypothetical protein
MNGLFASLRFPVALRGLRVSAAAVPGTASPIRTLVRPETTSRAVGTLEAPPIARPIDLVEPTLEPTAPAPAPAATLPTPRVEPSVPVSAAHLVDPVGVRVVPFRPTTRWPLRRAAPRIYDPFRGFPLRSSHLADIMDGRIAER